ncbi:hypothetical protein Tco_0215780 [Tanacetum coccineum]
MKPSTIAQARRNMIKYLKNQGNFKISNFKGMSYNDIRPIFEKIWDFNQNIEPMDTEHGSGKQKSPQKSPDKSPEKFVEEESDIQEELKQGVKEPAAKRKKFLDIVPREEAPIEVESISTKFPIVDVRLIFDKNLHKNYTYRLVKERYRASRPEGYDLMLWGDLHTMFEPNEDDELWKNQHQYNLLSWSLYDFCGIHMLLMENGMAIHMLTEKKYPLSQEMISKMLKKRLEVDHESTQAIELLRFIRSQCLYVHVLHDLPTLQLDSDFTLSSDSLGSDLVVSFPSGTRNKIFDPGIFIEVQSKRFLSPNEFSISFIRDPLSPVFDTLLPFLNENEDNVFNPGILASNEEKSPHLLSHRGFNPSKIISNFSESPMMISGKDIPTLDVPFLHFYPP